MPRRTGAATTYSASIPAPVGGLNAKDALADMPETDAVIMDNWFPNPGSIVLRNGYVKWATGLPSTVDSLLNYNGPVTQKLFAASGSGIYDVTAGGTVGAAAVSGLANVRFQHTNYGTVSGEYMFCVNGVDYPCIFDGTNWQRYNTIPAQNISSITASGTTATVTTGAAHGLSTGMQVTVIGATPAAYNGTFTITVTGPTTFTYTALTAPGGNATMVGSYIVVWGLYGTNGGTALDPRLLIHVNNYKKRIWFVEANSFRIWYLPVSTLYGTISVFDLSSIFNRGGYLMAMANITITTTTASTDYAAFVSSEGEVVLYTGTDPSDANNWSQGGYYRIGRPIGRRCYARYGADLAMITADGVFALSSAINTEDKTESNAISYKIRDLIGADVQSYAANFGWQPIVYPIGNKLFINVPQVPGVTQYQYVMNTNTNSWCRFTNWNANCFEVFKDNIYFGGMGYVAQCDIGASDAGAAIVGDVKPAFSYFRRRGQIKKFNMARPIFISDSPINVSFDLNLDFQDKYFAGITWVTGEATSPWNTSPWNTTKWAGATQTYKQWRTVTGVGFSASLRMQIASTNGTISFQATDYLMEPGGIL